MGSRPQLVQNTLAKLDERVFQNAIVKVYSLSPRTYDTKTHVLLVARC